MKIWKGLIAAAIAFAFGVQADEAFTVSYEYRDDGGCNKAGNTLSAEFVGEYEDLGLDVLGFVRTAPSGGNCEVDSLSYTLDLSKDIVEYKGFDIVAHFGADERSTSANYAAVYAPGDLPPLGKAVGDRIDRRDGNAKYQAVLPAGAAKTIVATVGACREFDKYEVCLGANVVPVDWARPAEPDGTRLDGSSSRTLNLRTSFDLPFSLAFDLDVNGGEYVFGDATLRWTRGVLSATVRHAFGLDKVFGGEPQEAEFIGHTMVAQGAPQSTSTVFTIGARFEI